MFQDCHHFRVVVSQILFAAAQDMLRLSDNLVKQNQCLTITWFGSYFWNISCPEDFGKMCGCKDHEEYHSLRLKNQELNYNVVPGILESFYFCLFVCLFVCLFFLDLKFFFLCVSLSFHSSFHPGFSQVEYFDSHEQRGFRREESKGTGVDSPFGVFRRVFVETPGATWSSRSFLLLWGRARVEVAVRTLADMLFVAAEKLKNLQCSKKKKVDKVEIVESWPATPPLATVCLLFHIGMRWMSFVARSQCCCWGSS